MKNLLLQIFPKVHIIETIH